MPLVGFKHSEESKHKIGKSCKRVFRSPRMRSKLRKAGRAAAKLWADPTVRANRVAGMNRAWKRKQRRENHREAVEASWERRDVRKAHQAAQLKAWEDPKKRASWLGGREEANKKPEVKRRASRAARRRWRDGVYDESSINATTYGPSEPQKILHRRLRKAGIKYLRLEHRVGRYRLDIAHLSTKTDIESDGKPWHRKNSKHDRKRDEALGVLGWTVIRVRLRRKHNAEQYDISNLVKSLERRKR